MGAELAVVVVLMLLLLLLKFAVVAFVFMLELLVEVRLCWACCVGDDWVDEAAETATGGDKFEGDAERDNIELVDPTCETDE